MNTMTKEQLADAIAEDKSTRNQMLVIGIICLFVMPPLGIVLIFLSQAKLPKSAH